MKANGEILVADDERTLLATLSAMLENAGYSVRLAKDGASALKLYGERKPDLVLLDVMMPKKNGFEVCREIRATDAETPVLFLTALEDEKSQLGGFGCGADDYIDKSAPDSLILARIAAALRRVCPQNPDGCFRIGSCLVRSQAFKLERKDGTSCSLTDREIALLRLFATHPDETLVREFLIAQCWGAESEVADGVLNVSISGLRKKLGAGGARIDSVHGVGYVYRSK